jgi:hypothetical protein
MHILEVKDDAQYLSFYLNKFKNKQQIISKGRKRAKNRKVENKWETE